MIHYDTLVEDTLEDTLLDILDTLFEDTLEEDTLEEDTLLVVRLRVLHNSLRHPPIQSGVTSAINIADCIRFQSPFGSNPHSVIYM